MTAAWRTLGALCLFLLLPIGVSAEPVRIGSKQFTESVILGELARETAREAGIQAVHQRELGGTSILWTALLHGDIDVYAEYTGTLTHELLKNVSPDADIPTLRARLQPLGIGITDSLGFNNTYAIGMREDRAASLGVHSISDLLAHTDLRFGFSNEFMDREDGWPGLRDRYGLTQTQVRGLDHTLAYRAVASGAVDAIDLYSTDAEIPYYHLRTLDDDRHYFPRYEAVYLYRLPLEQSAPAFVGALRKLAGRIDQSAMQQMNAKVKLQGENENMVVANFLGIRAQRDDSGFWSRLLQRSIEHIKLVALSLGLAVLLAIPLGILAAHLKRLGQLVIGLTGILQTVPSLAMFVFMIPLFGIGTWPAVAALFLYSLLPIVRNTHAGLVGIAPELLESAAAQGLPRSVRLYRVELPLATRSILAGIKTAAVINVGTATLAALIGAGGYGQPILTGIRLDDIGLILEGAVPAAVLALLVQGLFEGIERWLTPRGLRIEARQ
ncbi:glycine betaine ABC transporter substrate-binding protein [Rhodanobacter sp. MP7CTX1]|uniref:ABC transporter permease/substrate-binding protein n=1 Tax=Rhodanobacter sp. MP7CTX1 TaxID=2723084 RepID=UPI001621E2B8|nr:glycine betaine ABC transporter substrate-binding protein [Rhodanobacter sp. MP7CTX1]MBB6188641.1 osmoprotectant transport system permease protein [Rhodanobacter sp. MP7CTX1]